MLCQKCNKNSATVKIVKNFNGNVEEIYLCSACAEKEDLNLSEEFFSNSLFDNLFNIFTPLGTKELICENCNTSYSEFKKTGKFGCSSCYDKFKGYLDPLFKNIHGATNHTGKLPNRSASSLILKRKKQDLKELLKKAVMEENFEEAAKIRDEIKSIENEGGSLNG